MKDLNGIIKNAIKKALTEQSNAEEVTVTAKRNPNPEYSNNFRTYTSPDGRPIIVPRDLDPDVKTFDKQSWLDFTTSADRLQKDYGNYTTVNEDKYAKSCNDEYFKNLIEEFDKVSKDYIEIIPVGDKKKYPSDLDKIEGQHYYFILDKLRKLYPDRQIESKDFKGFDYYFKKMSEWLKLTKYKEIILVKGSKTPEQFKNVAEYNGADKTISGYFYPQEDIIINGIRIPKTDLVLSWWDWSLTNNKYCETEGSWVNYYTQALNFATNLIDGSVSQISVLKSELLKYYKEKTELNGKWDIDPNDNSKVLFSACFTKSYDGKSVEPFAGFYSYTKEGQNKTQGQLDDGKCAGTLFPTMAMILNANNIKSFDETGALAKYNVNSVVSIPLVEINVNPKGEVFKGKTKRDKRYEKGHDWFGMGTEGGADFRDNLGDFITWLWDEHGDRESTDPNVFQSKETITINTPLNGITKGLFKSTDHIDTTMVNEDTEVWAIPKEGLSPYIPGAIKPQKYGQPDWNFYYLKYKNPNNNIQARLPLPPASFWADYSDYYYKISNSITGNWMDQSSSEFGLVLTIVGPDNFNLVLETKGSSGWSLKIDNNTGGMYFSNDNKSLSNEAKDKSKNEGFDSKGGTWGSPQPMESYNFKNPTNLDNRSGFDGFWDSNWGLIFNVVVGVAISFIAPPLAMELAIVKGWGTLDAGVFVLSESAPSIARALMAEGVFTTSKMAILIEVVADLGILGLPGAASYWSRGEILGGWFSLLCSLIPLATSRTSFSKWSRKVWTKSVGESLNSKIINMGPNYFGKTLTLKKLTIFLGTLTRNEKAAFSDLLQKLSSNDANAIIQDTFKETMSYINTAAKKFPKVKKLASPKWEHNTLSFIKSFGTVGGSIFATQLGIRSLVDYFNKSKGVELTQEQINNLQEGLIKLHNKLSTKSNNDIISILTKMRDIDTRVTALGTDEWLEKHLKENQEIFDKMLVNNGWVSISSTMESKRKKDLEDEIKINAAVVLAIGNANEKRRVLSLLNSGNLIGNVLDKTTVQDKINIIISKYPCLSGDDFTFKEAYKSDDGNHWWVSYVVNSTNIKGTRLYFIGNGTTLNDDLNAHDGSGLLLDYNDTFNTNFPNCVSKSTNKKRLNIKTTKIPTNTIKH